MAASFNNGSAGWRRNGIASRFKPMSEINVTPLVDVMLVLLIVFMITAPLLTVGVPVDLPQTQAEAIADPQEPLVITLQKDGKVFIQESEVDLDTMVAKLIAITGANPETTIFVRADKGIAYGQVMELMGLVTVAGFNQVSLIVEMPQGTLAATPADAPAGEAAAESGEN
jgi:biopolymer transport protein TolR